MRPPLALLPLLISACTPAVPAACAPMCAAATDLYGACLEEWGLDWPAVGYDDALAHTHSCETWAWEAALLTQDAAWLDATCTQRGALLAAPEAPCEAYTDLDWDELPAR